MMFKLLQNSHIVSALILCLALTPACAAVSAKAATQLTWYGQSAYKIVTPKGHVLLIDPWINNPVNKSAAEDLNSLTHVDYILISHGHFDHVGDAVAIAKKTGAHLVANSDLGGAMVADGYPKDQAGLETRGGSGGSITLLEGEVTVTFTPAVHGSSVTGLGDDGKETLFAAGSPGGFVVAVQNGPTLYHTGDTDLFSDMALIAKRHKIDLMLCCIGDHFTMGPDAAAEAVKIIHPAVVIPMHYGTFPLLTGTPNAFRAALKREGVKAKLRVLQVHDTITL
ncbi:MAG: metal-dependent hydrolase [Capsulimonas sp.]|uniref:metal-dependent hydrolase n=1 Tax=Capsulimonas sp. TaxID=2494211 RepID=UPI00326496C9